MKRRFRKSIQWVSVLSLVVAALASRSHGLERFCKRAQLRSALPGYRYGQDAVRTGNSMIAGDMVEEEVVQFLDSPLYVADTSTRGLPGRGVAAPAATSVLLNRAVRNDSTVAGSPGAPTATTTTPPIYDQLDLPLPQPHKRATAVRRRRFNALPDPLDVDHIRLSRVGLAIYETGRAACTGTLSHSGGPERLIRGNYVTLRVRGFGTNPIKSGNPNGPMLFEFEQTLWLARGETKTISLIPIDQCEHVRRHFDEITHIEVNLEYRQNR